MSADEIVAAVVAEQLASDRWAETRAAPYPAQYAAWQALTAAYEHRVRLVRRWIGAQPAEAAVEDAGLFG